MIRWRTDRRFLDSLDLGVRLESMRSLILEKSLELDIMVGVDDGIQDGDNYRYLGLCNFLTYYG